MVIICVMLVISTAQTTTVETRMVRNTVLANQSRLAALAGLNFGTAWLQTQRANWIAAGDGSDIATPNSNPPAIVASDGDSFAINVTFVRRDDWGGYLQVTASAVPGNAAEIEAVASQFVRPSSALTWRGENAPPLIVDGCADVAAMNDLYPVNADGDAPGVVITTSEATSCINLGSASLHGGSLLGNAFTSGALWDTLLSVDRDAFQALASSQSDIDPGLRDYWWASADDLDGGEWRMNLGSIDHPVVLVIPNKLGCPRFSGGAQLFGLVFIEADCTGAASWGDVYLYGSLAVRGMFTALSAGSHLLHISEFPSGGPLRIEPPVLGMIQLAGSWKDF